MARRKRAADPAQMSFLENYGKTAPAVPAISHALAEWRAENYRGATKTSRRLLNYWFRSDHILATGEKFAYYPAQRVAVESLIYVYEVAKTRRLVDLYERFIPAELSQLVRWPADDPFARYCVKMATGSGKTKVMALAIAWQYFNAVLEDREDYAKTFLIIAPNVIVFERLRGDFAGGRVFQVDPVIPKDFQIYWDMQCYMRGESQRASADGTLYLTNIQQLYERETQRKNDEPEIMTAMLGAKPTASLDAAVDFRERILSHAGSPVLVINDEAHHTHDPTSAWNETIHNLHSQHARGLSAQLDFTATPRYSTGALFEWTISDYPLRQAIIDGIVKRPVKGIADIDDMPSDLPEIQYEPFIVAGVERWREYRAQLKKTGKQPLLFIMMNKTKEADAIGEYLRGKYPEAFGGAKTLIIHTDRKGDVSKRDLDLARQAAKEVDRDDRNINAIVSVLMLREGWDVKNVTVIVGLRPYSSKANILPEQTIGRGLRLMFRGQSTSYEERVDIIGNPDFLKIVEELEAAEGITLKTFDLKNNRHEIQVIEPLADKAEYDMELPRLSPIIVRSSCLREDIEALDIASLRLAEPLPILPSAGGEQSFRYQGTDFLRSEQVIERVYSISPPQSSQEIIAFYADKIARAARIPGQFAALAPKVRDFLKHVAFGLEVDMDSPDILRSIGQKPHFEATMAAFLDALRGKIAVENSPKLEGSGRKLSSIEPFPWSNQAPKCQKTIFNRVACDNAYEAAFAKFLDKAHDVARFAKLPIQFGFSIPYADSRSNLRQYYPDFVLTDSDATCYLLETKGREDIDVSRKDRAAQKWAKAATKLTGTQWRYLKVLQHDFESHSPSSFQACAQMCKPS